MTPAARSAAVMMRTWLVPVLPAIIIVGSTMREREAVPSCDTAYMPSRTACRLRSETGERLGRLDRHRHAVDRADDPRLHRRAAGDARRHHRELQAARRA